MEFTFHYLSVFFISSGFLCALIIFFNIFPRHRQSMKIMETVWPLTGLWASWFGLWAYRKLGKEKTGKENMKMDMPATGMTMSMPVRPGWQSTILSTLHCGAGCTLADLVGESFTSFVPITIGGSLLAGQWTLDYLLALIIGIYFQYAAIRPMENLSRLQCIKKAFKIDFFSLTAWQAGMYGWMAMVIFIIHADSPLIHNSREFWFMMQMAMFFGFTTAYPVNRILIKMGIKRGM